MFIFLKFKTQSDFKKLLDKFKKKVHNNSYTIKTDCAVASLQQNHHICIPVAFLCPGWSGSSDWVSWMTGEAGVQHKLEKTSTGSRASLLDDSVNDMSNWVLQKKAGLSSFVETSFSQHLNASIRTLEHIKKRCWDCLQKSLIITALYFCLIFPWSVEILCPGLKKEVDFDH